MAVSLGLALVAVVYVLAILVLLKTGGFRKEADRAKSFLHFRNRAIPFELGLIGLFSMVIGLLWLVLWAVFLYIGFESFRMNFNFLYPHVLLQLVTGLSLTISGVATLVDSKKWQLSYILGLILMICSTLVSLTFYGPEGHGGPFSMRFLGIWSFCVIGLLTFGFFVLHRRLNLPRSLTSDSGGK